MRWNAANAALAAAWLLLGCQGNPGFGLNLGATHGDASASTSEPATTTSIGQTSTGDADSDVPVTASSTSTGEPPPTTSTTDPTAKCGDGVVDMSGDELCDDGNNTPGDMCEPNCRPLFLADVAQPFAGECRSLLSAEFDPIDKVEPTRMDLALGFEMDGPIRVLKGQADGSFNDTMAGFLFELANTAAIARDIGGDGRDDILALQNNGNVALCLNAHAGPGPYCSDPLLTSATMDPNDTFTVVPGVLQLADVVDTPAPDLVVATTGEMTALQIKVFPGDGDGMFGMETALNPPEVVVKGVLKALTLASITGEPGEPDFVFGFDSKNDGSTGNVLVAVDFATDTPSFVQPVTVGKGVQDVAVADLGLGNDKPEILVTDSATPALWLITDQDGTYTAKPAIDVGDKPGKLVVTRLRGPASPTRDIVVLDRNSADLRIVPVAGDAAPTESFAHPTTLDDVVDFTIFDHDGDGDLDIVALASDCTVVVMVNQAKQPK